MINIYKTITDEQHPTVSRSQQSFAHSAVDATLGSYIVHYQARPLQLAIDDVSITQWEKKQTHTLICGSLKYSQHQSKNVLFNGNTSRMPAPVPIPRITLLPFESMENVLELGLGSPRLVCVAVLRRARNRSMSSSIRASITSEGSQSMGRCCGASCDDRGDGFLLGRPPINGVGGRE